MIHHKSKSKRVSPGLLRNRFQFGLLLAFIWVGAMVLRLISIQVFQHEDYVARAKKQRQSIIALDPERGPILDRKNRELAISLDVDSIYAIPEEMKDQERTLRAISEYLPINVGNIVSMCKSKTFVWVARKISHESAERIRQLKLSGIYFTQESRRFYPNKELAAHVLGFVGLDNKGLSGVEFQYDAVIRGIPGKIAALRDAKKRLLMKGKEDSVLSPTAGRTLKLTIDAAVQHIAERELRAVVQEQKAKAGIVIIMNPYTGEILAMANEPTYNPNAYRQFHSNRWRNRAIQDYFEPGSTFKVAVAAAALDQQLVDPEDQFDCQWGSIVIAGHTIHDHKPFGVLSFREVLAKSSDVGMIKIGLMLGPDALVAYSDKFGFGQKTGIDLSGEATGLVRHTKRWSAISIGAFSMGQEVGVTALQMVRMLSAVGNGGFLVTPHCVSEISDSSGKLKTTVFQPPQALSIRHTAITILQEMLTGVVESGTGNQAKIPGYSVAGKTGTAQKIGPSRTYADGGHIASFVGYAPANRPVFSMIVVLDDPKYQYHGGDVAAPLFRKIGQQVLKYLDIPPDQVLDMPALQAQVANPQATEAVIFPGFIERVAYTPPEQHHKLVVALDDSKASGLVMPPLYGKTVGETIEILSRAKVPFRLLGTGTVVKQFPLPGTLLNNDDLCIITLANSGEDSTTVADLNAKRR